MLWQAIQAAGGQLPRLQLYCQVLNAAAAAAVIAAAHHELSAPHCCRWTDLG
jgi:hypothetical protein